MAHIGHQLNDDDASGGDFPSSLSHASLYLTAAPWENCLQASFVSALVSGRSAEAGGRLGHCRKSGFWLQVLTLANKQKRK